MPTLETRPLGRTDLTVTRLGAGGHFTNGPLAHEDIPRRIAELNHLLDLGVTYSDVQWDPEELVTTVQPGSTAKDGEILEQLRTAMLQTPAETQLRSKMVGGLDVWD